MIYDYAIVGGGIGGLTLAYLLRDFKVVLIEKEAELGGCHRVVRQGQYLTEHGPRIISTSYINTRAIFEEMGIKWDDHFTEYNFQFLSLSFGEVLKTLSVREMFYLATAFIRFSFIDVPNITIGQWMNEHEFSEASQNFVDRLCRSSDGADKSRYLLHSFLNIFNQNFFYSFQQPKQAMDKGLLPAWESKLTCDILKEEEITTIQPHQLTTNKRTIQAKNIIFAMPPQYVSPIIKRSGYNPFQAYWKHSLENYSKFTEYLKYISVTIHFKNKMDLPQIWGLPQDSKWGIEFIRLTDYMNEPGDIFSIAITKSDTLGLNGKRADECYESEIKEEVWNEMNLLFHFPEKPIKIFVFSREDQAFVLTTEGYESWQGDDGFSMISTHAGKSHYEFTSMEAAVTNAIWLYNKLTGQDKKIYKLWTVDVFVVTLVLIFIGFILWLLKRYKVY